MPTKIDWEKVWEECGEYNVSFTRIIESVERQIKEQEGKKREGK